MMNRIYLPEIKHPTPTMPDLAKIVEETARKRAELIESFVIAYLKATNLSIEEIELVERYDGPRLIWYFRKKGSSD